QPLRMSGGRATFLFVVFFIGSMVLFVLAESALGERNYRGYWMVKFLFVTMAASMGIVISAVIEECVVARLSRRSVGNVSFYPSVFRANYITLGVVLLVAAVQILPKRLQSPNFITTWLDAILSAMNLG